MKNNSIYIFAIFILGLLLSCGSTKENKKPSNDVKHLTVSFYSPGNGINQTAKKEYDNFLKDNYPNLQFETILWGREGEIDYCFQNISLQKKEIIDFVQKTKKLLSNHDRINIIENKPCRVSNFSK